jgi:hypothetical protein
MPRILVSQKNSAQQPFQEQMEEADLKESNRHGNPSKSSRHATLSSSTFRLSGQSSPLVRTQGAVCLFVCVWVGVCVCVSLSVYVCACVIFLCPHAPVDTEVTL